MLGAPIAMLIPDVIGFKLTGRLPEGAMATDLVPTVTTLVARAWSPSSWNITDPVWHYLALPDRATIGNMAPDYGATCGYFPVDKVALDYMRLTGRDHASHRSGRGLPKLEGMFLEPGAPAAGVHRYAGTRSRHGAALAWRAEVAAGSLCC